jgi:hypothetical protein
MAASVQGWRTKWFYIKDRKVSSSDEYGLAPFDASQELKKLTLWDSPPTDAEMEEIKPLLTRIQALKGGRGGAFLGTQLMAFFLQHRVQPLQHHISKLWTFSGLGDSSRVSEDLMEKKDLDRRVRDLTTLTKDHEIAELAANYFDSEHPLHAECSLLYINLSLSLSYYCLSACLDSFVDLFICRPINSLFRVRLFQRKDLFRWIWFLLHPKPSRLRRIRTEMMSKNHKKRLARRRRLLLRFLKILMLTRRGSVSRSLLLRVPPLKELLPGKPLF